jgi:hypothetical protein
VKVSNAKPEVRNEEGKNDTLVKDERKDNKAPAEKIDTTSNAAWAAHGPPASGPFSSQPCRI